MQTCRAQGLYQPLERVAYLGNLRFRQNTGFPAGECFNIDVPELDHCRSVEHLVAQAMCRFIHIHGANNHQIIRVRDGRRHTADVIVLSMEVNVTTCLHGRKQGGQILLRVRQVHFVEHYRVWTFGVGTGSKQEVDKCRAYVALAIQGIDVTQQAGGIMPAWLNGDCEQALSRIGLPPMQRKRITPSQYCLTSTAEPGEYGEVTARMTPEPRIKASNQADWKGNIFGKTTLDGFQRGSLERYSLFTVWHYAG